MTYELKYFNGRARGEQIRLMMHELGVTFEDTRLSRDEIMNLRARGPTAMPFGSLPILVDGDLILAQGPVIIAYLARVHGRYPDDLEQGARADALAWSAEDLRMKYYGVFGTDNAGGRPQFVADVWLGRWLPNFAGLLDLNANSDFFVGTKLTHADIAVWDVLDAVQTNIEGATLDGFERLRIWFESVRQRPRLATYLANRPR